MYYSDKDLPIIGRDKFNDISKRLLSYPFSKLESFAKNVVFPWESPILDSKGKPFRKQGAETIKFRRYNNMAE